MAPGIKIVHRKKANDTPSLPAEEKSTAKETQSNRPTVHDSKAHHYKADKGDKDADIIVVDASVLVHALYQVKKWCRDGRKEILIVPLEALNTLDLLKKGTSPLAQRARAASRILESQVGTNPRISVQRDDAFVLWEKIPVKGSLAEDESESKALSSPEWVRRTICCARWEVENAEATLRTNGNSRSGVVEKADATHKYKVALAVLSGSPNLSPLHQALKLADSNDNQMTPVPLPAPSIPHAHKFEVRSSGHLVAKWAEKVGIEMIPVEPTLPGRGAGGDEEERPKRNHHSHHGPKGRRSSNTDHPHPPKASLVERPPAVMAMMEMVAQPTRVVRVLARGEELDP